jgi:dienelactone hydrolase
VSSSTSEPAIEDTSTPAPDGYALSLPEEARLFVPDAPVGVGVLVLLGSSGRMDVDRARLLARHGAHAMAVRWFGGEGQAPGVCEIPLEVFTRALDRLEEEPGVERLAVIGLSKGAEAATLLACVDDRLDLTVAMSPTSVVWANVGPGLDGRTTPYRSSWTWRGEPLPFVTYDETWKPEEAEGPITYRTLYEQSIGADTAAAEAAAIPVEEIRGDLLIAAGERDALWPSSDFARALADRRMKADRQVEVIFNVDAGHTPLFPGQDPQPPSDRIKRGGSPEADAALGSELWNAIVHRLNLTA